MARLTGDVVNDAHAVAESLSPTELQCFPNGWQPECFASVNSGVEVLALHQLECIQMSSGWMPSLGTSDVKTHHAFVAKLHGKLGNF